jgi:hypothetical protein
MALFAGTVKSNMGQFKDHRPARLVAAILEHCRLAIFSMVGRPG